MGVPGRALRGLVGQGMDGRRARSNGYARVYGAGSHTFTAPYTGRWKFILHGAGGSQTGDGGGSGAYVEKTISLCAGQTVALVVGAGNSTTDTTLAAAGQPLVIAGAANATVAGAASNGDVMINGTVGGTAGAAGAAGGGAGGGAGGTGGPGGGGAGAPGSIEFPGGTGASYAQVGRPNTTPGAGGANSSGVEASHGGNGRAVVFLVSS